MTPIASLTLVQHQITQEVLIALLGILLLGGQNLSMFPVFYLKYCVIIIYICHL